MPPLGCLFLKLSDDQKKIVLDKTFEAGSLEFEKLKEELPKDEGRYVLYDYSYQTKNGQPHKKIIFVFWNPDSGKLKLKMMYSSSKDAIKRKMEAVAIEVQANDLGDLDKDEIDDKLRK